MRAFVQKFVENRADARARRKTGEWVVVGLMANGRLLDPPRLRAWR